MWWAALYLVAVVLANVSVAFFGPASTPFNAFLLIGATLTLRDKLHDRYGPQIMLVLIPVGAFISAMLGSGVARIALAGAVAFWLSEMADTIVYHMRRDRPWIKRSIESNAAGALVDSVTFPVLAFGGFPVAIMVGQFLAKNFGGALWALIIERWRSWSTSSYSSS